MADINWANTLNKTSLLFYTTAGNSNPTEKMRINSNGNVGIGTASPNNKLHIVGEGIRLEQSSPTLILKSTHSTLLSNNIIWDSQPYGELYRMGVDYLSEMSQNFYIKDSFSNEPVFFIDNAGGNFNVGIGTSTPQARLEVNGSAKVYSLYVSSWVSALGYIDRTPYPENTKIAYDMINSIDRDIKNPKQIDHSKLHSNIKRIYKRKIFDKYVTKKVFYTDKNGKLQSKIEKIPTYKEITETGRDLSETISALIEVTKDLNKRIEKLEKKQ
jgi:hypothetical protein